MENYAEPKDALLDAILMHVPFDGWSETTLRAAAADTGTDMTMVHALFPRGAVDAALAFHARGDAVLAQKLTTTDLPERFRDKIALAVRIRLESVEDKEVVRKGSALFALPLYLTDGVRAIWGTSDKIWTALGDTSDDLNWYTKRSTLAGVYSATVLYWLGDDTLDNKATWDFLDRRIDDVMTIEKLKALAKSSKIGSAMMRATDRVFSGVKAPKNNTTPDSPGVWTTPNEP